MVENVLIKLNRDVLKLKLFPSRHAWIRQCCEIPQSCDPVCSKNIIHKHISIFFIRERIIISTRNDTTPNRRHSDFLLVDEWDRRSVRVNHHDSNVTLLINLSTHDHHQIRRIKVREREKLKIGKSGQTSISRCSFWLSTAHRTHHIGYCEWFWILWVFWCIHGSSIDNGWCLVAWKYCMARGAHRRWIEIMVRRWVNFWSIFN